MTLLCGCLIKPILSRIDDAIKRPPPHRFGCDEWEKAINNNSDRKRFSWLGQFERIFFYTALYKQSPGLIAGWLAFKLASKWEIWNHIMKVPEEFSRNPDYPLTNFTAMNRWGSWLLERWLVGTLGNILVALLGTAVAQAAGVFSKEIIQITATINAALIIVLFGL
jgi:hypothetical protein